MMKFEILRADSNQFYWRIVGKNGEVLAHSELYRNHIDAESAVLLVMANAANAEVVDKTGI